MPKITLLFRCLVATWVVFACLVKMAAANRKYPLEVHQMFQERLNGGRKASTGVGSWTSWSSWTSCSRTCGGGVATQTRSCQHRVDGRRRRRLVVDATDAVTSQIKNHCIGVYKRFHICNDQACLAGTKDFRQLQCEAFNRKQFMGRIYYWEPFVDGANNCELNCRPVGFRFYATLNKTVADGTQCRGVDPTRRSVCVAGQCKHVGCDGVIGSSKTEDVCGVCGGDNSTCRLVSGLFTRPQLPVGYNQVAQVPRGACNLTVSELKQSKNYLALRRQDGSYVINGDWQINWSGDYEAAGTRFTYKRQEAAVGESITAAGPLTEPVDLLLIYQQPNPGVKYEYMLPMGRPHATAAGGARQPPASPPLGAEERGVTPLDELDLADPRRSDNVLYPYGVLGTEGQGRGQVTPGGEEKPSTRPSRTKKRKFVWKVMEFSKCSKACGGGLQTSVVMCVREHNNQPVTVKRCATQEKPVPQAVRCNNKPCLAEWVGGEWSACSVTCGVGVQTRDVTCKQEITQTLTMKVAEGACLSPMNLAKSQTCHLASCSATNTQWQAGMWGQCSAACGEGVRTRSVQCLSGRAEDCPDDERPSEQEPCKAMHACATNKVSSTWMTTEWTSHCSEACGTGVQTRRVACTGSCDSAVKPDDSRACSSDKQCTGKWFAGPWGHCSARCGPGRETRSVVCVSFLRGQHRIAPDISCAGGAAKPDADRFCEARSCSHDWFTTDWTQCSKECGNGMQWREVKCLDEKMRDSDECLEAHEPSGRRTCNSHHCSPPEPAASHHKSEPLSHKSHHPSEPGVISVGDQAQPGPYDNDDGAECQDKLSNCHLVVQSRLCRYKYYRSSCCVSCINKP